MKIYYMLNDEQKDLGIPESFCGLVSIDIGYRTCGLTIINTTGTFKTIDFRPLSDKTNLAKLSIPEYYKLATKIANSFERFIKRNSKLSSYMWSMEIPNIIGSYAPALSILLCTISTRLFNLGIPVIFYTGNRLGGYFLKKRSYTKTEIKNLVKTNFGITHKFSDHEADSCLQAYSIYKGIFGKKLRNAVLRDFEVQLEDITLYEKY